MKISGHLLTGVVMVGQLHAEEAKPAPAYVSEAPLPEGWPKPGPYDKVTEKSYPASRAAFTTQKGPNLAFWSLFLHIQKNSIPMTAPVEMAMDVSEGGFEKSTMAFLYQSKDVGTAGAAGKSVEVRDVPACKVLGYTWQGDDSKENLTKARQAIEAAAAVRKLETGSFRLFGYNGPSTPRAKSTWELQVILK